MKEAIQLLEAVLEKMDVNVDNRFFADECMGCSTCCDKSNGGNP